MFAGKKINVSSKRVLLSAPPKLVGVMIIIFVIIPLTIEVYLLQEN